MEKALVILGMLLQASLSLFAAEKTPKKTICLNMIVKNESAVITRCLASVLPIIDTWVIVDTGSTDGTQQIIRDFLKDIPGELHERPWVNFGHNRQEALLLAKKKADYILFMDADDRLVFAEDFNMPDLVKDFYAIAGCDKGGEYWFPRLVKAELDWFWEGVVHEDLLCKHTLAGLPLEGVKYLYLHEGSRAKDALTAQKDIQLLEKEICDHPTNPRNFFYLARSYVTAKEPKKALTYFQKRAEMGGNEQEVFYSKLMIGKLQDSLQLDAKTVQDSFLKAHLSRPHRMEPLYYLASNLLKRGEYEKSYRLLELASSLPSHVTDYMYFEKWIYDYGLHAQLVACSERTQRYQKAIEMGEALLKRTDLPEEVRHEVTDVVESAYRKQVEQIQKQVQDILK